MRPSSFASWWRNTQFPARSKNGTLHCAVGEKGLAEIRERCEQWAARGAPVRILDAEETARRTGSTAYSGALLDTRAGTIQPLAYVRGLAAAARKAGARLHTESPVVATERSNGKWVVKTPQGSVTTAWIVVATEAYSTGPWQIVRDEQIYLPYFNFATRPLGDNLQKASCPAVRAAGIRRKFSPPSAWTKRAGWSSAASAPCAAPGPPFIAPGRNAR